MAALPNDTSPTLPAAHRAFLSGAMPGFASDARILGVTAGGSWVQGGMDIYSDLDLIVVVTDGAREGLGEGESEAWLGHHDAETGRMPVPQPCDPRLVLAAQLGPMLSGFTAEHTGERRMVICLYDTNQLIGGETQSPLHVDLKFLSLAEFEHRVEEPAILFDRHGDLARIILKHPAKPPQGRELAWLEGRWWTWIHFTIEKAMRGELWEALSAIQSLRDMVLGPMSLRAAGFSGITAQGLRRLETRSPQWARLMQSTIAVYDRASCVRATHAAALLYQQLRAAQPSPVPGGSSIERAVMAYVERCVAEVDRE